MDKEKRIVARDGFLANLRFFIDDLSENIYEGITINISPDGFGFLTEAPVREGQILTVTEHRIPDSKISRVAVTWVKKRDRYFEAGAKYIPDG